jgi:hypothetical protein
MHLMKYGAVKLTQYVLSAIENYCGNNIETECNGYASIADLPG